MQTLSVNALIFKYYFLRKGHNVEQATLTRVFPSGTHFSAELTEAIQIKCHALGHNIQLQPGFEPSITVSRNRHPTRMTNMLLSELR